jgi:hypothetical protein
MCGGRYAILSEADLVARHRMAPPADRLAGVEGVGPARAVRTQRGGYVAVTKLTIASTRPSASGWLSSAYPATISPWLIVEGARVSAL